MAIVLPLGNYHPLAGAVFFAVVGVGAVAVMYWVIKELLGVKASLFAAYLLAISPAWVKLTRDSRFNAIAALLFLPFIYFLVKTVESTTKKQIKYLFLTGLTIGFMYSFFPTQIVLLPSTIAVLLIYRKRIKYKSLLAGAAGLIIPVIPFLIHNALTRFDMLLKLAAWVPYRILGFVGLYPKNNADTFVIQDNFYSLYNFFTDSWLTTNSNFGLLIFGAVFIFVLIQVKKGIKRPKKYTFWITISIIFIVSYLGIFLHGSPPPHYYLVMFPIPLLFLASFLDYITTKRTGILFAVVILLVITITSMRFYFSDNWFTKYTQSKLGVIPVPYHLQENVVGLMVKDARGENISINRIGPLDHFSSDFSQNYIYLLWREGNEPVESAANQYLIIEDGSELSGDYILIKDFKLVKLTKKKS